MLQFYSVIPVYCKRQLQYVCYQKRIICKSQFMLHTAILSVIFNHKGQLQFVSSLISDYKEY